MRLILNFVKASIPLFVGLVTFSQFCFAQNGSMLNPITDMETIEYLFGKAVHLSGISAYPIVEMPTIYSISKKDLNREVCPADPENCRNLAAVFDDIGYRILVLEDLEISSNF
jgi:hypothetical protein